MERKRSYVLMILIIAVISILIMGCGRPGIGVTFCTNYGNGVYMLDTYASDNLDSRNSFHTLGTSLVKFLNEHSKLKIVDIERGSIAGTYIVITDLK